jgi:uncharacterized protein (TIGR03437 family)
VDLRYRIAVTSSLIFFASLPLFGAAKLRLDTTALGPFSIAAGANGTTQTVNATNGGDSALNLSAKSSASWLVPSVGGLQPCSLLGTCMPITIALNTASLAKGTYTGVVTVSDPNAIDAPQTITVTVNIGGGVPDSITLYVPSNGNPVSQTFYAGSRVTPSVTQPAGGPSLSLALPGGGSFQSTFSYTLTAQAAAGAATQTYNASMVVSGSPVSGENKTVPITLNVTSQPIAVLSLDQLNPLDAAGVPVRIPTNAAKRTVVVYVYNQRVFFGDGSGNSSATFVDVTAATASTSSGANWLAATFGKGYVALTVDPTGLQTGSYKGSVAVTATAANSSLTIPVNLDVIAAGAPVTSAVENNATFTSDTLAQGDFPAVKGEQFTTGDPVIATNAPYPTNAGGATVYINDQPVPLYYVSPAQINFLIPYETAAGEGTLRVDRDGQRGNTVSIKIAPRWPKLLLAANAAGSVVSDAQHGSILTVHAGDYLVFYGFGFGSAVPAVATNTATPASPFSWVPGTNTVFFGNGGLFSKPVSVSPQFIGLAPTFISAFYQINVQVPADAPKATAATCTPAVQTGCVPVYLQGDAGTTNTLLLNIQ